MRHGRGRLGGQEAIVGAHYTSEENILKLIKPLFLDDLWAEFNAAKGNTNRLFELHKKLAHLKFFDPPAGAATSLSLPTGNCGCLEENWKSSGPRRKNKQLQLDSLWREIQVDV